MIPFRELEVFDAFILYGRECDKVGLDKYLTYDELGEPESLEAAEPNMMVELIEEKEEEYDEYRFFSSLLDLLDGLERSGEKVTIKSLKKFAKNFLSTPRDP